MLIDFHTHCFPDAIAQRAIAKLSHASGGLEPIYDGTLAGLKENMRREGVDQSVVLNIATSAHQQSSVNRFAQAMNGDGIVAFGSVYPDAPDVLEEIDRIADMGLKGIKLHPEYQNFYVDDPKMEPIYRRISKHELIVSFHAGRDDGYMPPYHCTPQRLSRALRWLDTPVVAAHWGGRCMEEDVLKYLCGTDVYFDTAFGYGCTVHQRLLEMLARHGVEKFLFGTDAPWHTARCELRLIDSLELSSEEREKILFRNAQRLLGQKT